jgi:hypothetical protein
MTIVEQNEFPLDSILDILTKDETFQILKIKYDKEDCGNIFVLIKSSNDINIKFVRNRGNFLCKVGCDDKWHFQEDLSSIIKSKEIIDCTTFIDYINETSSAIKNNFASIVDFFDIYHSDGCPVA